LSVAKRDEFLCESVANRYRAFCQDKRVDIACRSTAFPDLAITLNCVTLFHTSDSDAKAATDGRGMSRREARLSRSAYQYTE